MSVIRGALLGLLVGFAPVAAASSTAADEVIPSAYMLIASAAGIPSTVLYAVASQESNRKINDQVYRPWPWTLNVAGKGYYYETQEAACRALHIALAAHNPKRVDVGIAQINLGWNPDIFSTPCEGLDPYRNLQAASRLLRQHYESSGSWTVATGLYHYPAGGEIAARYQHSVQRRMDTISKKLWVAQTP